MNKSYTKDNLFPLINTLEGYEKIEIEEAGVAYKLSLYGGSKVISFTWLYELGEVFFDCYSMDSCIYQDWFECLETDELKDFIAYIDQVAKRYLDFEIRVSKRVFFFRKIELQYNNEGNWLSILHS